MSTVKQGLYKLNAQDLIAYSHNVVTKMTGNVDYPTPTPALADITTAADALEVANEAAMNGGKSQHSAKRAAMQVLLSLMSALGVYVQLASSGVEQKILDAGMDVRKTPSPVGKLPAPAKLSARVSNYSGAVDLDWDPVENSRNYTVYINENDPKVSDEWTPVHATTKSKATISDLTPGTFYWFKVVAHGTAGLSPASDFSMGLAA